MTLSCPPGQLDPEAIELALSRLPRELESEYSRKLKMLDGGTIYELALLGRLLEKQGPFAVDPWPAGSRVDAYLRQNGFDAELEIKASIETLYEKNVRTMCEVTRKRIEARWPRFTGRVNLCNPFRDKIEGGIRTLDIQGTADDIMQVLEKAFGEDGIVGAEYRTHRPLRLVTKIEPCDVVRVWHSSWTPPADHDENVIRRVLKRSLTDRHQFSGNRVGLLAIILARDPDPDPLYRSEFSPADVYFRKYPHLSGIIAVPCPSINGPPILLRPEPALEPVRKFPLSEEIATALAEFFVCRLQVSAFWEEYEERLRVGMNQIEIAGDERFGTGPLEEDDS